MNTKDQWALFWCSVLHELIFNEVAPKAHARHLKQLSEQPRRFPNGVNKKASLSTLKRKWKSYQQGGFDALVRKGRCDRGQPRKVSAVIIDEAGRDKTGPSDPIGAHHQSISPTPAPADDSTFDAVSAS